VIESCHQQSETSISLPDPQPKDSNANLVLKMWQVQTPNDMPSTKFASNTEVCIPTAIIVYINDIDVLIAPAGHMETAVSNKDSSREEVSPQDVNLCQS